MVIIYPFSDIILVLYIILVFNPAENDTTFELPVYWPSRTENRDNELRFSESISLSIKTRLTSVALFCGDFM